MCFEKLDKQRKTSYRGRAFFVLKVPSDGFIMSIGTHNMDGGEYAKR